MKKYNKFIFLTVFGLNLITFLYVYLHLKLIELLNSDTWDIVIPKIAGRTNAPKYTTVIYEIFQFDFIFFIGYLLCMLISFYIITNKMKVKIKVIVLIILEILFIYSLSFHPQYIIPFALLLNFSIILTITIKNYMTKKPNKLSIICLLLLTTLGMAVHFLFKYHTIGRGHIYDLLLTDQFFRDFVYVQNVAKYFLIDRLTHIYIYFGVFLIVLIIFFFFNKKKRKNEIIKYIPLLPVVLFLIMFTRDDVISTFSLYFLDDTQTNTQNSQPISGCYQEKLSLNLGDNYLNKNNEYFVRCFQTTEGQLSVYKEANITSSNYFNVIEEIEYQRIFIRNEQGEEILSVLMTTERMDIYATTIEEYEEGYDNIIVVLEYANESNWNFPTYTIYNISGKLLFKLPYGLAELEYLKQDPLYLNWKLLYKNNKIVYITIVDDERDKKYIYYIDGTRELIEDEE